MRLATRYELCDFDIIDIHTVSKVCKISTGFSVLPVPRTVIAIIVPSLILIKSSSEAPTWSQVGHRVEIAEIAGPDHSVSLLAA